MKNKDELIGYIRHLLKTNKSLTLEDRKALKSAVKELRKPGKPNPDMVTKILEILLTGLSVGVQLLQYFHR